MDDIEKRIEKLLDEKLEAHYRRIEKLLKGEPEKPAANHNAPVYDIETLAMALKEHPTMGKLQRAGSAWAVDALKSMFPDGCPPDFTYYGLFFRGSSDRKEWSGTEMTDLLAYGVRPGKGIEALVEYYDFPGLRDFFQEKYPDLNYASKGETVRKKVAKDRPVLNIKRK